MKKILILILFSVMTIFFVQARDGTLSEKNQKNSIMVYPPLPDNLYKSDLYEVLVSQSGKDYPSYVYKSVNTFTEYPGTRPYMSDANHWTSFSFNGKVAVKIRLLQKVEISSIRVLPSNLKITSDINGNEISIILTNPANIYVKINDDWKNPFFIFANPPEENIPEKGTPGVLYFGPGLHEIGTSTPDLPGGTTIYLAGGAYVKGVFKTIKDAGLINVRGRGILSGIDYPKNNKIMINCVGNTAINAEGITLTDAPHFNITSFHGKSEVNNVKVLSWQMSTDGIDGGEGSIITGCFLKVNDDALKPDGSKVRIINNTVFQQTVGSVVQFGWNHRIDISDVHVKGLNIIASDMGRKNFVPRQGSPIIDLRNLDGSNLTDVIVEDVTIEKGVKTWEIVRFCTRNLWTPRSVGKGSVERMTFRNIICPEMPAGKSTFDGNGEETGEIKNITFENVSVAGTVITDSNADVYVERRNKTSGFKYIK
jgi:hypothetical protein